jgi:hypothetical protein
MMRLALLILCLWPALASAQSRTVLPEELDLTVMIEEMAHTPFVREMVLLTIRGVYRRHITLEELRQPDLDGFSWTQLGPDSWKDERIGGEKVKTMTRRMAVYPDRAGELTIGAFTHKLTLTDETDNWFEHQITSAPVTLTVAPAPVTDGWWFPVRELRITDNWSNAPDQLKRGEGVLRVMRLEAVGVTPEMIPPMPDLRSPSGMIFPHPDQRLVELSPDGPITYAFWRWTIRPGNDTSAVVEPLTVSYYDTTLRQPQEAVISAQRIAYGDVVPAASIPAKEALPAGRLPGWPLLALGLFVFAGSVIFLQSGRDRIGWSNLHRFRQFDPLARQIKRAARNGDAALLRRSAAAILQRDGASPERQKLLTQLDAQIYGGTNAAPSFDTFPRKFLAASHGPTPVP